MTDIYVILSKLVKLQSSKDKMQPQRFYKTNTQLQVQSDPVSKEDTCSHYRYC